MSRRARRVARKAVISVALAGAAEAGAPALDSEHRPSRRILKRLDRQAAKDRALTIQRPLTEADIPPGSLLSESTLAAIRGGSYLLRKTAPPPQPPQYSRKALRRQRHQMAKRSRRRNRGR